jgi:hypothetical protein
LGAGVHARAKGGHVGVVVLLGSWAVWRVKASAARMAGILFAAIYSTSPELPITMPAGVAGHPVGRTAGIGGRRDAGRVGPEAGLSRICFAGLARIPQKGRLPR